MQTVTQRQIMLYFGTNSTAGVPVVDPSVDWDSFTNWPDEFTFRGETYQLHLDRVEGDYSVPLLSRAEVKTGTRVFASYKLRRSGAYGAIVPGATWGVDGSVVGKELSWRDAKSEGTVFVQHFDPTGNLYLFSYTDFWTSCHCTLYYTKDGDLIGDEAIPRSSSRSVAVHRWAGALVSREEFLQLSLGFVRERCRGFRAQPDGPANGSQPIRSGTNTLSSSAGSRR